MSYKNIYFEKNFQIIFREENCPSERMGHVCQIFNDKFLIVWGGHRHDDSRNEKELEPSLIWIFNVEIEKWKCVECKNSPPLLSGACGILLNDEFYIFGGCKRATISNYIEFHHNDLYKLSLRKMTWEKCQVLGKMPSPRDKLAGWAHENKLYYFGGFGPHVNNNFVDQHFDFVEIPNYQPKIGWNNQLIYYDIEKKTWNSQKCSNLLPKPRAAHTCTKINDNQVVLFGGRTIETRSSDLFVLNLNDFSWTGNLNQNNSKTQLPIGRSWHTMTKLNDNYLFMYGGLSQLNQTLGDGWLLNTKNFQWELIETSFEARLWHTTIISKKTNQIYVFGGSNTDVYINQPTFPKHMLKISLTPESLKTLCIEFICSNLDLFESKLSNQLPFELEKSIELKYFSLPKLEKTINDEKKYVSRSEYCIIQ